MKSKRSSGLGGGNGTSERQAASTEKASRGEGSPEGDSPESSSKEDDSIEESLNKLLAEADPEAHKAASDPVVVETAAGGDGAEPVTGTAAEATPSVDLDADRAVPVRTPDELAAMSGPALVDDAKEEVTDVESPEALAALAAASATKAAEAAETTAQGEEPSVDAGETPVRDALTAGLLKAVAPQEEIVTATGGSSLSNNDVITAENVGFFTPGSEARRTEDGESSIAGDEASTANLMISAEAREERDRVMRRSRPPTSSTPLPRLGRGASQASGDEPEAELELSDLDYDGQRSPDEEDEEPASRRTGSEAVWPSTAPLSDSGPVRRTPPPFSASITGTGRHTLPPPGTPTPGARGRLPTPHSLSPLGTPGPRISSAAIPIQAPIGSSGGMSTPRSTSAVFSKVQLPLGGLVTVVGAAFGVGLIIGAVLWRGSGDASADSTTARAGGETRTAPPAPEPAPAAPPPAPVAATPPTPTPPPTPPAPAAVEPPAPPAPPAAPPSPAASATASGSPAPSDTMTTSAKKVAAASASAKLPRPRRSPAPGAAGAPAGGTAGKAKAAAWVDPFAQ